MARPKGALNVQTAVNAGEIFDLLAEYPRTGLTKREIMTELDLTATSFQTAFNYLKDVFQEEEKQPVVYDPRSHKYRFAKYIGEAKDYGAWVLKRLATHTRRHEQFVRAMELRWPNSRQVKRIARLQAQLADEVAYMLAEVSD
jgi:hypothetical protein